MHLIRGPMSVRPVALFALVGAAAPCLAALVPELARADEPAKAEAKTAKPPPEEVEIVDVTDGPVRSPQWLSVGLALGGGYLTVKSEAGHGSMAFDAALTIDFGLGPGGDPTTWTLGPYLAAAFVPFGDDSVPNRFAELGARLVRRFEAPMWVSLGLGLAVSNHRIVLAPDLDAACAAKKAPAADCGTDRNILGAVLDLGVGLYEARLRTVRWGVGARVPVQLSAHPGVGAFLFLYGSVGVGR